MENSCFRKYCFRLYL